MSEQAKQTAEYISGYLSDAVRAVMRMMTKPDGTLEPDPDLQYAVRLLQSRQRRVWAEFDAEYAEDPQQRVRAALALQLNDNGEFIRYANVNHAKGRLDCKGCDFTYIGLSKEPLCVVCRFCNKGVEHVRTVTGPHTYHESFGDLSVPDGHSVRWHMCDECGSRTVVPVTQDLALQADSVAQR